MCAMDMDEEAVFLCVCACVGGGRVFKAVHVEDGVVKSQEGGADGLGAEGLLLLLLHHAHEDCESAGGSHFHTRLNRGGCF